ncbi:MAG: potassium transporter TrkH [Desulfobacteraceae bacterium]|nr:potassium transporter TrkH [Desulfobacteraceae bacterium]
MSIAKKPRSEIKDAGAQGLLIVFSFMPLLSINEITTDLKFLIFTLFAFSSFFLCGLCGAFLIKKTSLAKKAAYFSSVLCFFSFYEKLIKSPSAFLFAVICLISVFFIFMDYKSAYDKKINTTHENRCYKRSFFGSLAFMAVFFIYLLPFEKNHFFSSSAIHLSLLINQVLFFRFSLSKANKSIKQLYISYAILSTVFILLSILKPQSFIPLVIVSMNFLILFREKGFYSRMKWLEIIIDHPARILISGFLIMCVFGTFLLYLPSSSSSSEISLIDAAFTSVSAVCVTGLIVLDTPVDFSASGQFFILVLIQLGGLGIMTITAAGLHAVGQRLSLKQEKILTTTANTDHKTLFSGLKQIVLFTFAAETAGAVILSILFILKGDSLIQGTAKGIFTSVSAFCNAGFALNSDSLIGHNQNPLILHTIAVLIILGGLAPATTLLIPKWIKGQKIPVSSYIPLSATAILLISGTVCILVFEWNGFLSDFDFSGKIHNAWFQSVTLRTAGFNSVDLGSVSPPMLIVMIIMMFIGGSPGGTAGGVKTTAFALILISFAANIKGRKNIVVKAKTIPQESINKALTAIVSGAMLWFAVVIMLETTQSISTASILFEAASALGTVGLTTGATPLLDEIGKIIIMAAMFTGRIGSVTLFMLLTEDTRQKSSKWPEEKITIT